MKYRFSELLAAKAVTTETITIPINLLDPISRIDIVYRLTLASNAMQAQLGANLTKIELVDGSDVLHSMNGLENQALCIYDRRVPTMNATGLTSGAYGFSNYGIDFGRWLYDPELAFDPTKFRNPQLKITFDVDACDASAAAAEVEVFAHCFDEKVISPVGFLMSKRHHAWTPSGADVYEYIDLPLDYPIRQLLIRGFLTTVHPDGVVDYAKISEEHDKKVVFDMNLSTLLLRMKGVWLPVEEGVVEYAHTEGTYTKYVTPTSYDTMHFGHAIGAGDVYLDGYIVGGVAKRRASASVMVIGAVRGWCPNHSFQIPFGNQADLDDWYDVTGKGSVILRLMSGGSCSTTSVVSTILQQLRRY